MCLFNFHDSFCMNIRSDPNNSLLTISGYVEPAHLDEHAVEDCQRAGSSAIYYADPTRYELCVR